MILFSELQTQTNIRSVTKCTHEEHDRKFSDVSRTSHGNAHVPEEVLGPSYGSPFKLLGAAFLIILSLSHCPSLSLSVSPPPASSFSPSFIDLHRHHVSPQVRDPRPLLTHNFTSLFETFLKHSLSSFEPFLRSL